MVGLTVEVHDALGERRAAEPATPPGADSNSKALARWKRAVAVNALLQPYAQVRALPATPPTRAPALAPNPKTAGRAASLPGVTATLRFVRRLCSRFRRIVVHSGVTLLRDHFLSELRQRRVRRGFAKLIERCSDGVKDQGAKEALWGQQRKNSVSFGSRLPCERLSFQREPGYKTLDSPFSPHWRVVWATQNLKGSRREYTELLTSVKEQLWLESPVVARRLTVDSDQLQCGFVGREWTDLDRFLQTQVLHRPPDSFQQPTRVQERPLQTCRAVYAYSGEAKQERSYPGGAAHNSPAISLGVPRLLHTSSPTSNLPTRHLPEFDIDTCGGHWQEFLHDKAMSREYKMKFEGVHGLWELAVHGEHRSHFSQVCVQRRNENKSSSAEFRTGAEKQQCDSKGG